MNIELWIAVHDTFKILEETFPEYASGAETELKDTATRPEAQAAPQADGQVPLDNLVQARSRIRSQLEILRDKLSEQLSERDVYLVLFPIVAHFDELVQTCCLKSDHRSWPPLQGELFQIDNAGEVFYDTLDDLMLKPQTLPFVLAVFYLCLNNGFVGRYAGNPARRNEYLERLRAKIPLAETGEFDGPPDEVGQLQEYRSPVWYYGTAGAVLLTAYFIFLGLARIYNPLQ